MITYLLICQPIRKQSNVILLSVCCNGNFGYANSVCQIKVYIKKKKQIVFLEKKNQFFLAVDAARRLFVLINFNLLNEIHNTL